MDVRKAVVIPPLCNAAHHSMVDSSEKVTLSWENVEAFVEPPKRSFCRGPDPNVLTKQVLRNVYGLVKPGTLLAIIGASGSGKTTLLNTLTSRNNPDVMRSSGNIRINGVDVGMGIRNISAYVQQDDMFIATMTVREHLTFRALLRMEQKVTHKRRIQRVDEVIKQLGLVKCAENIIGDPGRIKGISGGELRRLSFASEILTNPPLFFCDEPTSGLDSFMAENIVMTLKAMSKQGKTILCTIHQPSSEVYALFDNILVMSEGRVAYMGSAENALNFFSSVGYPNPVNFNPADFFIKTMAVVHGQETKCKSRIETICDAFAESKYSLDMTQDIASANANPARQGVIVNDRLRFEVWVDCCRRKSPVASKKWEPSKDARVCSKHFELDSWEVHPLASFSLNLEDKRPCRLKTTAIPTIFSYKNEKCLTPPSPSKFYSPIRPALRKKLLNEFEEAFSSTSRYESAWYVQFAAVFKRCWWTNLREPTVVRVRMAQTIAFAVMLGLIYRQLSVDQEGVMNINGVLFLLVVNMTMTSLFGVLNSFPIEMPIFIREYGIGLYRVDIYFICKMLAELPSFIFIPIMSCVICYWMVGLYASFKAFLIFTGVMLIVANIAVSFGYMVSTLSNSVNTALAISPALTMPLMMFGGFLLNSESIPKYFIWLEYMSWFKYSNELIVINQWENVDTIDCPAASGGSPRHSMCLFKDGDAVIQYLNFTKDNYYLDIGLLFVLLVGYRLLAFLILLIKAKRSKRYISRTELKFS